MSENRILIERKYIMTESSEDFTPLSSFRYGSRICFRIETPSGRADTAVLRIHRDTDEKMFLYPMQMSADGREFSACLSADELCPDENGGLFFYCYDVYFPDGCVSFGGEEPEELLPITEDEKRQLLIYRADYSTPAWMRGGIIYHIFVDRFCRGADLPLKCGARMNPDWENGIPQYGAYPGADVDNNEFFGGDLYGVAEKLDYIASLGVSCIYLSPVFDAASNHKYDTGDYEHVDSMFGGDAALKNLIDRAREKGIRVILDGVFNHTGADSRYFNKFGRYSDVGAHQSTDSPYYGWYSFTDYPEKYDCWWGVKILPKVRCDEPSYRQYILGEQGIIRRWMEYGIAGWRLDVADELSDGFLDALRTRVRTSDPQAVIYGEVWENATNKIAYGKRRRYLCGTQLDSVMNYPLKNAVISYIRDGDHRALRECIHTIYRQYPKESADVLMNFLGTHDTVRILTELGGEPAEGKSNAELAAMRMTEEQRRMAAERLKIAYQLVSVMPGLPCIFYGDEAGLEGYGDPFCRRPFPWGHEDQQLTAFYREVGRLHRSYPVFRDGYVRLLWADSGIAAVLRYNGKDMPIILLVNRTEVAQKLCFSDEVRALCSDFRGKCAEIPPMTGVYFASDNESIRAVSE